VTFTCIYPGGGRRVGIDRNQDGVLDGAGRQDPAPAPAPAPAPGGMQPMQNDNAGNAFLRAFFRAIFGGFRM